MPDNYVWDDTLFDPMAFSPSVNELKFAYPLLSNWLGIIRADFAEALTWAKTANGYTGATPDFVRHLESARINGETEVPVVAVRAVGATPTLNENQTLVEVVVEFDTFLMIGGSNPDTLSYTIDTYVLALSQLWYQAVTDQLFASYHDSAKRIGNSTRELLGVAFGENVTDDEKIRKGQYRRTALLRMETKFYCG